MLKFRIPFFLQILVVISLYANFLQGQGVFEENRDERIVFYNVENLFDVYNDSLKNDDEFTPEGIKNWGNHRFYKKLNNIYKVILGVGEWDPPSVIGLCEVENEFVLNKLIYETPLTKFDYRKIHFDSPDKRGIDVALIYRKDRFIPVHTEAISIKFPFDNLSKTRDILYVKGVLSESDTFHLFVNHWTSRYGGYMETKPKRNYIAKRLRSKVDSIFNSSNNSRIVIMGDFNDEPFEESLQILIHDTSFHSSDLVLVNLMEGSQQGTVKYRENWIVFDQFIVSQNLFTNKDGYVLSKDGIHVYKLDFLLENDDKFSGQKPFRSFSGPKYIGGFSDHLPVYIDLIKKTN